MTPFHSASESLLQSVLRAVRRDRLLDPGDSVLVGVSGGPDSVALLHALRRLASDWDLRLAAAHLNHGLRGEEAKRDQTFVEKLADTLDLPFYIEQVTSEQFINAAGQGPEAAARKLRYRFFRETARREGFNRIALGHNANDNAELVLMRFLRGSGPSGLAGMPVMRDEIEGSRTVTLVRPLLDVRRKAILAFLADIKADYVIDSSNTDTRFLRNQIRHHLIPHIEKHYNPDIVGSLNRLSDILRIEEDWLTALTRETLRHQTVSGSEGTLEMDTEGFDRLHAALQRRLLRAAILKVKGNLERIRYRHVEAIRELALGGEKPAQLDFPDRLRASSAGRCLRFSVEKVPLRQAARVEETVPDFEYHLFEPSTVQIRETGWRIRISCPETTDIFAETGQLAVMFDMGKVDFPITIRNFRPGDRFNPSGMTGSQKLKKFFIDHKIPRAERRKYPLLLSAGNILWIAGLRKANIGLPDATTRDVLKAELLLV